MAGSAPHQGAQARQHLLHVERLGDVVVGAGVEPGDLLAPAVASGQNQHRHGATLPAPALEHRDPVHDRQAQIEHHGIVGLVGAEIVPFLAVGGEVDGVPGIAQAFLQLPRQVNVVFDHQNPHRLLLPDRAQRASRMCPVRASTLTSRTLPSSPSHLTR